MTLELIWMRDSLTKIDFPPECPMRLYGDNNTTIHIVKHDVFHERTKHTGVDCHKVHKKIKANIIMVKHVASGHHLADLLTKPLGKTRVDFISDKLGIYDIHAPA